MAIDQNFINQYSQLLILQYSDKEKAAAEIALLARTWSTIFDFMNSFFDEFDIDQAYGDRLDIIGRIVGISRIVENGLIKRYFGFSGITNALSFGEAPMFDLFRDTLYTDTELNDTQYKFFIKAKIAKNVTSAYLVSDDRISLQKTLRTMFNDQAFYTDNKDMSLTLYVEEVFQADDLQIMKALDLFPKPQGVQIQPIVHYDSAGTFGFAQNLLAKTFGEGKFASIIS